MKALAFAVILFVAVRRLWRREYADGTPHETSGMLAVWIAFFGIIVLFFMI